MEDQKINSPHPEIQTPLQDTSMQKKSRLHLPHSFFAIGLIIIILFAIGYGVYYFFLDSSLSNPFSSNPSPTPIGTNTPTPITENWNTYIDEQYGYSIQYPKDWNIIEADSEEHQNLYDYELVGDESQKVTFLDRENTWARFQIIVYDEKNLSLDEWILENIEPANQIRPSSFTFIDTISVGGQDFKHYSAFEFDQIGTVLIGQHNGKIFNFHFPEDNPNDSEFEKDKQIYSEMLSSFKFLSSEVLSPTLSKEPISCTLEAKLCPDGSSVGREGPNCEFAPCPSE